MRCIILLLACLLPHQRQDVELQGARLETFLKSRGVSEIGRDVKWKVNAKVFNLPKLSQKGWDLYVHKGIGIVVPSGSIALEEVRRRGGTACVRGQVEAVPPARKKKGDPDTIIVVRELSRRR